MAFWYPSRSASSAFGQRREVFPASVDNVKPVLRGQVDGLGNKLVWSGQAEAAVPVLKEVIRSAPDTPGAYIRLAEAWRKLGRPENEVAALHDLARVQPGYPMLHVLTAQEMQRMDSPPHQQILAELAAAEKRNPADPDIFYLRGKTLADMKQYGQAIAAFRRARPLLSARLALPQDRRCRARTRDDRFEYLQPAAQRENTRE